MTDTAMLEDIGNIGELIGGFGVIVSLIYVGFQVRQNTTALVAQMHERLTSGYMDVVNMALSIPTAFGKGLASTSGFQDLAEEQRLQFFGLIFAFFKHFEHMYVQHQRGLIDQASWEAWSVHIRMYFHQPGVLAWWALRKSAFVEPFRSYLEASEPPPMPSMVDVLQAPLSRR